MYKIIVTLVYGQFGQTLYQNMRKDLKYAQRLQILYNYILNISKILLDTVWISYSNCDEQKFIEKVFFLYRKNAAFL